MSITIFLKLLKHKKLTVSLTFSKQQILSWVFAIGLCILGKKCFVLVYNSKRIESAMIGKTWWQGREIISLDCISCHNSSIFFKNTTTNCGSSIQKHKLLKDNYFLENSNHSAACTNKSTQNAETRGPWDSG